MRKQVKDYYDVKRSKYADSHVRVPFGGNIDIDKAKKIHISGVCGKFMASFAGILLKLGYQVTGADEACYAPMSNILDDLGLAVPTWDPEHIDAADIAVIPGMATPKNIEAAHARKIGKPYLSAPEFLGEKILKHSKSIVVAGTHGKTTTTSIAAHLFSSWNDTTGFLVGGVLNDYETSFGLPSPNPEYFVIEGDEYDTAYFDKGPKFLHYYPYYGIITSIEYDHVDIYPDFEDYKNAFGFFAAEIHRDGKLFVAEDVNKAHLQLSDAQADIVYYGFGEGNGIQAKNLTTTNRGSEYRLIVDGKELGNISIPLFGEYNVLNTLPLCGIALEAGISFDELQKHLASFPGVKQRQQILYADEHQTIIRDFAHHPTAVDKTLKAFKDAFSDKNIIAVFEPRSNSSRRPAFLDPYINSFEHADTVYLSQPPFRHNDTKDDFISIDDMKRGIEERYRGKPVFASYSPDEILEELRKQNTENSIVIFMSNGFFGGIDQKFVDFVKHKK